MGDIYGNANLFVACLPGILHSELMGSDLHRLCTVYENRGDSTSVLSGTIITSNHNGWSAIKSVMQDLYWTRLWII